MVNVPVKAVRIQFDQGYLRFVRCIITGYIEKRLWLKEKYCLRCGNELSILHKKYCSRKCSWRSRRTTQDKKICEFCGIGFLNHGTNSIYCSTKCIADSKYQREHERRIVTHYKSIEKFSRQEIFERDNWKCQLCGFKVKRNVVPRPPGCTF